MKKLTFLIVLLFFGSVGFSQSFTGGFSFNLPGNDSTTSRFLPKFPIQQIDPLHFVSVNSDGNFSVNGNPIRFWGVNLVASGVFGNKTSSPLVAGRMRKFGINLVRMHHIDNCWTPYSLLNWTQGTTRSLNTTNLDKLDYMFYSLKQNGIYTNMNLNVSRVFRVADGVPTADSLLDYGKGVTIFDPKLIALQKEYATQLLTHVNPYTQLSYANDPAMGVVEIINENSVYRMWVSNGTKPIALGGSLTWYHTAMLDSLFIKYLTDKYGTTANLNSAWGVGSVPPSNINLLPNGGFENTPIIGNWQLELHNNAAATVTQDLTTHTGGLASAKVNVTAVTGTNWHIQFKQVGSSIKKDSTYQLKFKIKGDKTRTVDVSVMRDDSPYTTYGYLQCTINTNWQEFSVSVKPNESISNTIRISFTIGNELGSVWLDDVSFMASGLAGLLPTESLELKNVKRLEYKETKIYTDARMRDISQFYIGLQDSFFDEMKVYLKNTLGVKCPIVGTNWNVGAGDLASQDRMDYIDNHAYWDHPTFPNIPWSGTDWLISNTPMVQSSSTGTIKYAFASGTYKKPYTLSEYNHPFPNRFACEAPIFLTAYSSFHNLDGLMIFEYSGALDEFFTDKVTGYFETHRISSWMGMLPSAAYAYRNGYIKKANQTLLIDYSKEYIQKLPLSTDTDWNGPSLFDRMLALKYAVRTRSYDAVATTNPASLPTAPSNPYKTDTDEITYDTNGMLIVDAPKYKALTGYFNTFTNRTLNDMTVLVGSDFGAISWISLTNDSLKNSALSLITITSKVQNRDMIWDGNNTIHDNWGSAPTANYPLSISMVLNIKADSIKVYPLDTLGNPKVNASFVVLPNAGTTKFAFTLDQSIYKSLWFGIEKFGLGAGTDVNETSKPVHTSFLQQNYPNPFNDFTQINYGISEPTDVKIEVYDVLGKRVKSLVNEFMKEGEHQISWNGKDDSGNQLSTGIYFIKLYSNKFTSVKKGVILK